MSSSQFKASVLVSADVGKALENVRELRKELSALNGDLKAQTKAMGENSRAQYKAAVEAAKAKAAIRAVEDKANADSAKLAAQTEAAVAAAKAKTADAESRATRKQVKETQDAAKATVEASKEKVKALNEEAEAVEKAVKRKGRAKTIEQEKDAAWAQHEKLMRQEQRDQNAKDWQEEAMRAKRTRELTTQEQQARDQAFKKIEAAAKQTQATLASQTAAEVKGHEASLDAAKKAADAKYAEAKKGWKAHKRELDEGWKLQDAYFKELGKLPQRANAQRIAEERATYRQLRAEQASYNRAEDAYRREQVQAAQRAAQAKERIARQTAQFEFAMLMRSKTASSGDISSFVGNNKNFLSGAQQARGLMEAKDRSWLRRFASAGEEAGKSFVSGFKSFAGSGLTAALTAGGVIAGGTAIFKASASLETLRLQFEGIYKDSELATKQYEQFIKVSQKYGGDPTKLGAGFARFAAGAKDAGFTPEQQMSGFTTMMKAGTALNMTPEKQELATKSLSDMLSKGIVQAEELRGQLADHIPNAVQLGARALGMSTQQMFELMKNGQIKSAEFVKLLLAEIEKDYAFTAAKFEKNPLISVKQLNTEMKLAADTVAKSGFNEAIGNAANKLTLALRTPEAQAALKNLGQLLGNLVDWLMKAGTAVVAWVRENQTLVVSVGKAVAGLLAFNAGWFALKLLLGGPLALLGGIHKVLGLLPGGFTAMAASAVKSLGSVVTQLTKAVGLANMLRVAVAGAAAIGLARTVSAGSAVNSALEKKTNSPNDWLKGMSNDDLATLASDVATTQGDNTLVRIGTFGLAGQNRKAELEELAASVKQEQLQRQNAARVAETARMKAEAASIAKEVEASTPKGYQNTEEQTAALRKGAVIPGKGKGNKSGSGASAGFAADRTLAKKEFEAEREALREQLEANKLSYVSYYAELRALRTEERDDIDETFRAEIAKEKDAERRQELEKQRQAARLTYIKDITKLNREEAESERRFGEERIKLQADLEARLGDGVQQQLAEVDEKYRDVLERMVANGDVAGERIVRALIKTEKAKIEFDRLMRGIEQRTQASGGNIDLLEATGQLTPGAAQAQRDALRREMAQEQVRLIQEQLAKEKELADNSERRLDLERRLVEAKLQVAQLSTQDLKVTEAIGGAFESFIGDALGGKFKSVKDALRSFLDNVLGSLQKDLAKTLADQLTSWMKQALSQQSGGAAGGGDGSLAGGLMKFVGGLFGMGGGAGAAPAAAGAGGGVGDLLATGLAAAGSGAASTPVAGAAGGGGFLSGLAGLFGGGAGGGAGMLGGLGPWGIGLGLLAGGLLASRGGRTRTRRTTTYPSMSDLLNRGTGGVSAGSMAGAVARVGMSSAGGGMGGHTVIQNISTPDANSFRASSSQLRYETQNGLSRAAQRNG